MLSITEIEQINQKLNPELALSLSLDNAKRMESSLLHSGFSPSTDMWKLILFYNGSLEEIKEMISFSFIPLLGNFAILFIKEKDIPSFLTFPQVLYVELSRPIYENALTGIDASCFPDYNIVTGRNVNATTLTGKGTAIAVLDSGVDYRHPDFRNVDGSTRILAYWDQSLPFASFNKENTNSNSSNSDNFQYISTTNSQNNYIAADNRTNTRRNNVSKHSSAIDNPYNLGVIFSEEDLNRLLMPKSSSVPSDSSTFSVTDPVTELLSPSEDVSGHGTHIAGICSGNGRASNGNSQGVAPESRNLVVDHWVTEVVSGKKSERDRKLGALLRRLKKNDTLIVTEISRLSRTLTDIMAIMGKCLERGINLYTTKEGYSFDNTINSKVLCFAFGLVAEIERNLISMRTREALALRRAEGMVLGRRYGSYTKLNVLIENRQTVIAMLDRGKSIGDICRHFGLSRDTFAKFRVKYLSVQKALDKKERLRISRFKSNRTDV